MFDAGTDPVRPGLVAALGRTCDELGRPGTWWDAEDKGRIALVAREAHRGAPAPQAAAELAGPAAEAATVLAATPARTSESWVQTITGAIGEPAFVELVGIVARMTAVDTFCRLLGRPLEPLPRPQPGEPSRESPPAGLRRNRTWVAMAVPSPPFVLGAVPAAVAAMNDLTDELYMPPGKMGDPDWTRGHLHRSQMELVAATVSHENECFY